MSVENPLQNVKHEAILQRYFADPQRVGWRAYKHVCPQVSERSAKSAFSRLLKSVNFSQRLAWLQKSAADQNVMSLNEVLVELSKLGRSNIQNVVVRGDDTGDVVEALRDLPPEQAATIQELTVETYVEGHGEQARDVKRVKVKLHGKHAPLAELRRHYEPMRLTDPDGRAFGSAAADKIVDKLSDLEIARRVAFVLTRGEKAKK